MNLPHESEPISRPLITASSLAAGLGVALGAFGAHALESKLATNGMLGVWQTAVTYQMLHAIAVFAVAITPQHTSPQIIRWLRRSAWCWLSGILLFSGSLYGLALGGPRLLGPITPIGGLLFLAGWGMAITSPFRGNNCVK